MTEWVLIIFVSLFGRSTAVTSVRFKSYEACEKAYTLMVQLEAGNIAKYGVCVEDKND